jgi:hypothetical protein
MNSVMYQLYNSIRCLCTLTCIFAHLIVHSEIFVASSDYLYKLGGFQLNQMWAAQVSLYHLYSYESDCFNRRFCRTWQMRQRFVLSICHFQSNNLLLNVFMSLLMSAICVSLPRRSKFRMFKSVWVTSARKAKSVKPLTIRESTTSVLDSRNIFMKRFSTLPLL